MNAKFDCGDTVKDTPFFIDLDGSKVYLKDGEKNCKFLATSHEDDKIATCDDKDDRCKLEEGEEPRTYKQAKHWTVVDWCTGEKVFGRVLMNNEGPDASVDLLDEITVITSVSDDIPPVIDGIDEPTYWGNPYDCNFELKFENIEAKDECPDDIFNADFVVEIRTADEHGNTYGGSFAKYTKAQALAGIDGIPAGAKVTIIATAWDCCGNTSEKTSEEFTVGGRDEYAPICVANDELEVSLVKIDSHETEEHEVGARVYAEDVDEGSKDNCGIKSIQIRKAKAHTPGVTPLADDANWTDYIDYSNLKDNLGLEGGDKCSVEVWVDLRVEDHAGNYSICPSRLILRDNTPVEITSVDPHTIVSCLPETKPSRGGIEVWGNCYEDDDASEDYEFHCPVDLEVAFEKAIDLTIKLVNDLSGDVIDREEAKAILQKANGSAVLETLWYTNVDVKVFFVSKKTEHGFNHEFAAIAIFEYSVEKETFKFPQDIKVECEDIAATIGDDFDPETTTLGQLELDEILIINDGCSEWVMNVTQKVFRGADDACLKVVRNYEFINWCRWDENLIDDNTQIDKYCADINAIDGNNDGKLTMPREYVSISFDKATFTPDNGFGVLNPAMIKGSCSRDAKGGGYYNTGDVAKLAKGYFNYTQIIKINDDVNPTLEADVKSDCIVTNDCETPNLVTVTLKPYDGCSDATVTGYKLQPGREGDKINDPYGSLSGNVISGDYPTGKHSFHVRVDDECGNSIWQEIEFEVGEECKKPTPIGLANFTALMNDADCTVEIWASDINSSSMDNCTDPADLDIAIYLVVGDNVGRAIFEDEDTDYSDYSNAVLTTSGRSDVALWVRDEAGNTQFTVVPVVALDNGGCATPEPLADVAGKITNENDESIDQVVVSAKGNGMTEISQLFSGLFNYAIPMHADVTISAEKNDNHLNGVSTADLVLLQRHVLGITPLTSAYKMIAADANNDTNIDTRDMLHISRLILGIYDELPSNTSWRFVAKDHVFANPTSPWGFAEAINFADLDADAQADFVGVKIGDLSGNALPSNLLGSDDTKVGAMTIAIDDATIAAGETQTIEFTTADFNDFAGYQFSIALDSRVDFAGIEAGNLEGVSDANFGLAALENGVITTNWTNVDGLTAKNGTVMFSLTVTANETVKVSDILTVNSAVTAAEAYNSNLDAYSVGLKFNRAANAAFELFQNTPNPVNGETVIGFNLPSASAATLKVMDVAGKTILVRGGTFAQGYNQITLDRSELNATGVLYYQLDTDNNSATKKMIILE
ncbi:MAG: T9SS type A sorting domain-containing protein [Flavobacteriales bacterium]|nr:T9SS type A sorting domain-containing protein [Flavobacteriales bacterium]